MFTEPADNNNWTSDYIIIGFFLEKPTFPQMPTARCLSAVVMLNGTLKTALVVAGGLIGGQSGKEREW